LRYRNEGLVSIAGQGTLYLADVALQGNGNHDPAGVTIIERVT
jgi:hypothetical protein